MQEDEASSDPNSAADSTEAVGQPCLRLRDWRPLGAQLPASRNVRGLVALYGVYLHDDEDKLERVEEWKLLPVHQFIFLQIATNLARAYFAFTGIVREVLDEPALV